MTSFFSLSIQFQEEYLPNVPVSFHNFLNNTPATSGYLLPLFRHEVCFCLITDHPKIVEIMEEMYFKGAQPKAHPLYIQGKFYEMLGLLYENCIIDSNTVHMPDERFTEVLTYVNSFYTENISTHSISQKFGYEEAYFCRHFKKLTGLTTMKYIRLLRMEMAQNLLLSSLSDINTISQKCEYADSGYFSQCFKQQFGVTPQEFRDIQTDRSTQKSDAVFLGGGQNPGP